MKLTDITEQTCAEGWKVTHKTSPVEQVELRKKFGRESNVLIIVGKDGYDYKTFTSKPDGWGRSTKDYDVHMSMNGPLQVTLHDFNEIYNVVHNAKRFLSGG